MNCTWQITDEKNSTGRTKFVCSRNGCPNKCYSNEAEPKLVAYCGHPKLLSIRFGDLVADAISVATAGIVTPCGGCKERQAALNSAGEIPAPNFLTPATAKDVEITADSESIAQA